MNRRTVTFLSLLVVVATLLLVNVRAYTGGWGDSALDYNCGSSCHIGPTNHGTGVVEISANKPSVITGQGIVIAANVTEDQLGGDALVGVFLLRSASGTGDSPTMDGWEILQDPKGGANNYVEIVSPGPGATVTFRWTLKAPATPGDYTLLVRVHHGSTARNPLWEDSAAFVVTVTPIPPGVPSIDHTPVSAGYVGQEIPVEAWVVNATTGVFLHWRRAGEADFQSIEMTNTSEADGERWRYEAAIPAQGAKGGLEYYLVATRDSMYADTPTFTVTITPVPVKPDVSAWIVQLVLVVESIAIVTFAAARYLSRPRPGEKEADRDG
ncbi:MAG: hypothetical protein AABY30_06315 [Candidatus Thermoplasmatota archaeon]